MKAKNFTYGGTLIGSYLGWSLPLLFQWESTFFDKFGLSMFFGIICAIFGYQLFNFLKRKF